MNADRSYRIILADDHALFLSGLQGLLSRRAECEVVGTAANGEECLALMQESYWTAYGLPNGPSPSIRRRR